MFFQVFLGFENTALAHLKGHTNTCHDKSNLTTLRH